MKKLILVVTAMAGLLAGCAKQDDTTSPPAADAAATNAVSTNK